MLQDKYKFQLKIKNPDNSSQDQLMNTLTNESTSQQPLDFLETSNMNDINKEEEPKKKKAIKIVQKTPR